MSCANACPANLFLGYFGDIGKATNDLLGRDFNYDHKLSIGNKTDSGMVRAFSRNDRLGIAP